MGLREDELGPTRTELEELLRRHPPSEIAKMYLVHTDHVRQWCAVFGVQARRNKETDRETRPARPAIWGSRLHKR